MTNQRFWLLLLLLALGFLSGCSKKDSYDTVNVTGKVTVDGQPMEGINVVFSPVSDDGSPGFASTDAQGNYKLSTPGAPAGSGAISGTFIPTFNKTQVEERLPAETPEEQAKLYGDKPAKTIYIIPKKYGNKKTSGIEPVTVKKGKKNVFDFGLLSK